MLHDVRAGIALVVVAVRAATNLGVALGPPLARRGRWSRSRKASRVRLGGVGLLAASGRHEVARPARPRRRAGEPSSPGVVAVGALSSWAAARLLPAGAGKAAAGHEPRALGRIATDAPFLLLTSSLGFVVYFAYETVLPVVAVDSFGLRPAAWGLLVALNPTLVTLFQIRLTRALRKLPQAPKLGAAMLLMGLPYLVFLVRTDLAAIVVVILLVVLGEMLWLPTSQALAVSFAPRRVRGAYMGAFGASTWIGWTIGPLAGSTCARPSVTG